MLVLRSNIYVFLRDVFRAPNQDWSLAKRYKYWNAHVSSSLQSPTTPNVCTPYTARGPENTPFQAITIPNQFPNSFSTAASPAQAADAASCVCFRELQVLPWLTRIFNDLYASTNSRWYVLFDCLVQHILRIYQGQEVEVYLRTNIWVVGIVVGALKFFQKV
jgi:hypothetical protein